MTRNFSVVFDGLQFFGHSEWDLCDFESPYGTPEFAKSYHTLIPRQEPWFDQRREIYHLFICLYHWYMDWNDGWIPQRTLDLVEKLCNQ